MIVSSEGQAGDVCYLLSILKKLKDGPHTLLLERSSATSLATPEVVAHHHRLLESLVMSQSYIKEFRPARDGEQVDWRSGGFRNSGFHSVHATLIEAQQSHLIATQGLLKGVDCSAPWLKIDPYPELEGLFVVNRTSRYQNGNFPWHEMVKNYGDRMVFMGLEGEHKEFCQRYAPISYRPTTDYLEAARLIKGCQMFIGNQSCLAAIAVGMGHDMIMEVSTSTPDCIFNRSNIQYVTSGEVSMDGMALGQVTIEPENINLSETPPHMWQHNGHKCHSLDQLIQIVSKELHGKVDEPILRRQIIINNVNREKGHYFPSRYGIHSPWARAFENAGLVYKH